MANVAAGRQLAALLLFANVIGVGFRGGAVADDGENSQAPATAAKVLTLTAADRAEVDKQQYDAWHKNLAEWEAWEPGEPADNSFCNVCHSNLEEERLVDVHLPEGVGCETCHGISDTHSEDEDSLIPPDVMFARSTIAFFCIHCHDKDGLVASESDHKEFFAAMEKRRLQTAQVPVPNGSSDGDAETSATDDGSPASAAAPSAAILAKEQPATCINCHDFQHAIKNRTRRWSKKTRKLEWYDGVQMMQTRDDE